MTERWISRTWNQNFWQEPESTIWLKMNKKKVTQKQNSSCNQPNWSLLFSFIIFFFFFGANRNTFDALKHIHTRRERDGRVLNLMENNPKNVLCVFCLVFPLKKNYSLHSLMLGEAIQQRFLRCCQWGGQLTCSVPVQSWIYSKIVYNLEKQKRTHKRMQRKMEIINVNTM